MNCEPCTMSQWNWFKYNLKRRLNRNYNKESEMHWEFMTNPAYQDLREEVETVKNMIPLEPTISEEFYRLKLERIQKILDEPFEGRN